MRSLNSRWVRLVISLALLALVIQLADWRAIADVLRSVDPLWALCAAALALSDRLLLNLRWQVLLAARGFRAGFISLFRVQLAANLLGSFLPSSLGVDAIRIAGTCRLGLSAKEAIAATLVDRITLVVATLLFGSLMVVTLAGTRLAEDLQWLVLSATVAATAVCASVLFPQVRRTLRERLLPRLPARVRDVTSEIATAALAYRRDVRRLTWIALITVIVLAVRLLFAAALAAACGADVTIRELLVVIPILWILVMLPISVGGLGIQDAGYVALMAMVSVPAAIAVSMSLIEHVITRLVVLPGAFFLSDVGVGRAND